MDEEGFSVRPELTPQSILSAYSIPSVVSYVAQVTASDFVVFMCATVLIFFNYMILFCSNGSRLPMVFSLLTVYERPKSICFVLCDDLIDRKQSLYCGEYHLVFQVDHCVRILSKSFLSLLLY